MSDLLKIENLNYKKNNKAILEDINLNLNSGKIIGLLGENGAGKTTLMRLIAGVNSLPEGVITVDGATKKSEIKQNVSLSDQLGGFNRNTKIGDIVRFYQNVYPDFSESKYLDIAKFLELEDDKRLSALSTGTKGKFIIALALARETKLYLLDEPLSGIDSMSRKKIISSIIRWKDDDSTIIISDHYVTEIASLLDDVIIIKDKTIYQVSSVEAIQEKYHLGVEEYYEQVYEGSVSK
ncbi:ABC transporter ATP-binding protein [Companilactobacillus nantensis]|uniref:ABC transporter-like protein n=1 Tax=Companilactobacillus nantensis DSM 16982 TaxID=1423774 RepID=A0A0R1WIL8_9LACO|nr:ABC transporter ATP-binding protein [Companilactobacillus nantensis]KRM17583.1 ABC transporter-like protein [Companilactobacillus nantensis DSM 16982]GEO64727.1 ABC transporter ATP-binding protein [Companilactobacillus nantensis]